MAKSVGMARLAYRRWWGVTDEANPWYWTSATYTTYRHAKRYLRRYARH